MTSKGGLPPRLTSIDRANLAQGPYQEREHSKEQAMQIVKGQLPRQMSTGRTDLAPGSHQK